MANRNVVIKYQANWRMHEDQESYKDQVHPEYRFKKVSSNSYRRYYNTLCILAGISKSARDVLDYCCERMDNNNIIHSNRKFREQFITDVEKWTKGKVSYTDSSVKKAIYVLTQKGLLLKEGTRGTLKVNPEYFFKGTEQQRLDQIKTILEFNEKQKYEQKKNK